MISKRVSNNINKTSWIREMFENGNRLAEVYGRENVYDFSLGNPFGEPPSEVQEAIKKYVLSEKTGLHRYMSNSGYSNVREKVAEFISYENDYIMPAMNVVMTVGAAGGLNIALKTLLNEGEEVIVFAPYFAEYNAYVDNYNGKIKVVSADKKSFQPDLNEFEKIINKNTKAVILNSPNNPTGIVYKEEILMEMSKILAAKESEYGNTIYVISDEPYSKIIYDGIKVPSVLNIFNNSIIVNSFSKSLGLAGERIGYVAVSNKIADADIIIAALTYCNRTLGFVNAPSLFQKVVSDCIFTKVNVEDYQAKRDFLYDNLTRLGFQCIKPQGAFYLFPKSPIEDDIQFIKEALKYNILLVPGSGFSCPGYFRMSYCVEFDMLKKSIPAFEKLAKEFNIYK